MLKLNLGCGASRLPGFVNVDKFGDPDVRHDLEVFPWPWETSSVGEVVLSHVLEHLGQTTDVYLGVIRELYRVCAPDATIHVVVPHPRHDDFLTDPTHVRAVTPGGLAMFSKRLNRVWQEGGFSNTTLGLYLDVDLEIMGVTPVYDEPWASRLAAGEIDQAELDRAARMYNNVVKQYAMGLRVVKPETEAR